MSVWFLLSTQSHLWGGVAVEFKICTAWICVPSYRRPNPLLICCRLQGSSPSLVLVLRKMGLHVDDFENCGPSVVFNLEIPRCVLNRAGVCVSVKKDPEDL